MRIHKTVETDSGEVVFKGSNKWIRIDYKANGDTYFRFMGRRYNLDLFMRIDADAEGTLKGFHGHHSESAFSGVVIELDECGEAVKAFYYYC
jgi:hypothetical protein